MPTLIQHGHEADHQPETHRKLSDEPLPLRKGLDTAPGSGDGRRVFRTITRALPAPFLYAVALLGFVWVGADLTWYRLRCLYKGRRQPRGLWDI